MSQSAQKIPCLASGAAVPHAAGSTSVEAQWREIDRCAICALEMELRLYPKAGLVSFVDAGSHDDMDASTFLRSIEALEGYFGSIAHAGATGAPFSVLKAMGMKAEARMLAATGGINTHRGAVFSLGLLAAAAGRLYRDNDPDHDAMTHAISICHTVADWGPEIVAARPVADTSHGAKVRARYGMPGAREQAATGYPVLRDYILPTFVHAVRRGRGIEQAGLQAFYTAIAVLEDNNLLYRAGPEGLAYAQDASVAFLAEGGIFADTGYERAQALHEAFVARRLSPGGAADLLAATFFLAAVAGMLPTQVLPWR